MKSYTKDNKGNGLIKRGSLVESSSLRSLNLQSFVHRIKYNFQYHAQYRMTCLNETHYANCHYAEYYNAE